MHFIDAAALWVQSIEPQLKQLAWPEFCKMIHECLDRDQHRLLIRQTFHIHWETTVKEYVDRFAALIDQLKFYNPATDPLYLVTRFIDGLRDDVRAVVIMLAPQTLDTAYSLAVLQEKVAFGIS